MTDFMNLRTHCAVCRKKTAKEWREGKAYCLLCGRSCMEMAAEGLNTAGPWHQCPKCQDRHYYEEHGDKLHCEACGLTIDEATAVDAARPIRIGYRPRHVTAGSIMELSYLLHGTELPVFLHIFWGVGRGTTTLDLRKEDFPKSTPIAKWNIDVPDGAVSAKVVDLSGRSRSLAIPIEFQAVSNRKISWVQRLFGI